MGLALAVGLAVGGGDNDVLDTIAGVSQRSSGLVTVHVGPFAPSDIAGLVAWFRGDALTTLGGAVSSWTDQSPIASPAVQAVGGLQPASTTSDSVFNNKGSVTFDGTGTVLSSGTPVNLTAGYTIFTTFRIASMKNYNGLFRSGALPGTTGDGVSLTANSGGTLIWGQNDTNDWFWQQLALLGVNTVYTACLSSDGTAGGRAIFLNGTDITGNGSFGGTFSNILAAQPIQIGEIAGAANGYLNGKIAEQIVYNSALSPTNRGQVDTYLRARYANY